MDQTVSRWDDSCEHQEGTLLTDRLYEDAALLCSIAETQPRHQHGTQSRNKRWNGTSGWKSWPSNQKTVEANLMVRKELKMCGCVLEA